VISKEDCLLPLDFQKFPVYLGTGRSLCISEIHMARLPRPIKVALALDLSLVIVEGLFHPPWLPLGGNHCAQLGICLGAAVLICEMFDRDGDDDRGGH